MSIWNRQRLCPPPVGETRMRRGVLCGLFLVLLIFAGSFAHAIAQERYTVNRPIRSSQDVLPVAPYHTSAVDWETDSDYAMERAKIASRRLLIYLYTDQDSPTLLETTHETYVQKGNARFRQLTEVMPSEQVPLPIASACREFDTVVLDDPLVRSSLDWYVLLKLPMNAKVTAEDGSETPITSLPGFEHMAGHPGLVMIDFASRDTPYYGQVTGILPFWRGVCPTAEQTEIFLNLPPGTLTQRTLTYAVRIHPDKPLSSNGEALPLIGQVATKHALYQAETGVMGHQNFGTRSHNVVEALGGGMPSEICAESWSDESMFEGAIGCMRAWRNSSAHWAIARKNHRFYGYDMAKGKNGAWFAVGFFID